MNKKRQQWMLPLLALLFLLVAAYYYYLVMPVQADVQRLNQQIAQTQAGVKNAKNQGKTKANNPERRSLQKMAELMPVEPYTDQLIKDLGKLQSISSVEITNASFSDENIVNSKDLGQKFIPTVDKVTISQNKKDRVTAVQNAVNNLPPASIHTIEITLSVKGKYDKVYAFVYEVENLSRYLRLDSFSFGGGDKAKAGANGANGSDGTANGNSISGIIGNAVGQANAANSNAADSGMRDGQNGTDAKGNGDLTASIKLTTYFVPQFASLLDKLPAVQVEPPSGKWDPTQYPVLKKPEKFSGQQ